MEYKTLVAVTVRDDFDSVFKKISLQENSSGITFLIVDDGSDNDYFEVIKPYRSIKYVRHESPLGTGASYITAYEYSRDNGYDFLITPDSGLRNFDPDIHNIFTNLKYGYDIVTCSRVLENPDYRESGKEELEITGIISGEIQAATGFDITDPLSMTRGCSVKALEPLELVESGYAVLLQQIIQAAYFGLTHIELPLETSQRIGREFSEDEDLDYFLKMMETEKFLFKRGEIN